MQPLKPSDQQLDNEVALMLRAGVTLAALIVLSGGVLLLMRSNVLPDYAHFHGDQSSLRRLGNIWQQAVALSPRALVQLGLVVLIATPIARVVLCVVGFARQRSGLYVGISVLVLAILIYSLFK